MTSDKIESLNRQWWHKHDANQLEFYDTLYAHKTQEEILIVVNSLQRYAWDCVGFAFDFLMMNRETQAHDVLDKAIAAARAALEKEDFEHIFGRRARSNPEYLQIEKQAGRMNTLKTLHYAIWFRTGVRPLDILKESWNWYLQYYKAMPDMSRHLIDDVLVHAVEAELYQEALSLFQNDYKGIKAKPTDMNYARSDARIMSAVSTYALSDKEIEPLIKMALNTKYRYSQDWTKSNVKFLWWNRLSWAWLWGRHVTGITTLKPMLTDLRGYFS